MDRTPLCGSPDASGPRVFARGLLFLMGVFLLLLRVFSAAGSVVHGAGFVRERGCFVLPAGRVFWRGLRVSCGVYCFAALTVPCCTWRTRFAGVRRCCSLSR